MLRSGGLASHGSARQNSCTLFGRISSIFTRGGCRMRMVAAIDVAQPESCLMDVAAMSSLAVPAVNGSGEVGAWLVSSRHGAAHAVATVARPVYDLLR